MRTFKRVQAVLLRFEWDMLGFGLCRAWISMVFTLPVPALLTMGSDFSLWYFVPGAVACLAFGLASGKIVTERARTIALVASAALSIVGVAGMLTGAHQGLSVLLVASLASAGAGAALLQTLWGDKMAGMPIRDINLYTVASMLFAALLSILSWSVSSLDAALLVFAMLPAGSCILLYRGFQAGRWPACREIGRTEASPEQSLLHLGRLCVSIFVFVFVFNFAYTTFPSNPLAGVDAQPIRSIANVGVTVALLATLLARGSIDRMSLYRLSFPILLGALLLVLVVPDEHAGVASIIAATGYKLFDVLFWCVLVGLAHESQPRSWRVLGFGMAANFAGMGLGVGLRTWAQSATSSGALDQTLIVCGLMFALAIVTMLILPESVIAQIASRGVKKQRQGDAPLSLRCSTLGDMRKLTAREREVLELLAQGRTQSVIARKLSISEGTAHTHIMHVYQKIDVHSQQELIDVVESISPDHDISSTPSPLSQPLR